MKYYDVTVEEDYIEMPARLVRGVQTVNQKHVNTAERWAKQHGRTLTEWGGDFKVVRVKFEPPLTLEEYEELFC